MQEAVPLGVGAMTAIMGLSIEKIEEAIEMSKDKGIVQIANYNTVNQIVIGGELEAVNFAANLCLEYGAKRAISLKGGDQTIYVETGYLKNNLQVKRIKSVAKGITIFVGASAWTRTPEGIKLSDLMIWLEYGTDNSPPRPLIRPTWGEVEPILRNNWKTLLQDLIETGGK